VAFRPFGEEKKRGKDPSIGGGRAQKNRLIKGATKSFHLCVDYPRSETPGEQKRGEGRTTRKKREQGLNGVDGQSHERVLSKFTER